MALVNIVNGETASTDKSISLYVQRDITLYTVPDGRKFEGVLNSSLNIWGPVFRINGQLIYGGDNNTPVKLLAGDVVSTAAYPGTIFGIESDA